MNKSIIESARKYAMAFGIPFIPVLSIIDVETPGVGFNHDGKILIQFEPRWYRRWFQLHKTYAPSGLWSVNGIERQNAEWKAFNNAFHFNPEAAMYATSIGLGQILGCNYKQLGYRTVGEMWDDAKVSEDRQVYQLVKFIATKKKLRKAVIEGNTHLIAYYYNGPKYLELSKKINREPYNISLAKSIQKFKKQSL